MTIYNLEADDFWYIKDLLMVKYSVNLLPAFLQLCGSDFLSFRVCFLKLLEPKTYSTNAHFIRPFVIKFGL